MSATNNEFLISLKIMSGRSPDRIKDVLATMQKNINWLAISSVYRVVRRADSLQSLRLIRGEEVLDGFSCVVKGVGAVDPQGLLTHIQKIEHEMSDQKLKRTVSINCLVFGNSVIRTPQLTLPHPEFHMNPEEVIPAAEVWPEYNHPILNKTMSQLANSFQGLSWGEYYGSGKEYL